MQKLFFKVLEKLGTVKERLRIGKTCVPELVKKKANRILTVYLQ